MESQRSEVQASLDALAATSAQNVERLQRPRRYWMGLASMMMIFPLLPYAEYLPPLVAFILAPVLVFTIALIARRNQPTAVRKIRLSGAMWVQLLGFALTVGIVGGLSRALYSVQGWLWFPAIAALVVFALVAITGPALDRYWARRVSRLGE